MTTPSPINVLQLMLLSPLPPTIQSPGAAAGTTVDTLPHITAQMQQLQIAAAAAGAPGYPSSHPAAGQQQFHLPTHAQYHGNLPTAAGGQVTHPQWAIAQVST